MSSVFVTYWSIRKRAGWLWGYSISQRIFPRKRCFRSQIRRTFRSIGAQVAEAWAKRRYQKHFLSKLTDADAEQQETQHWTETAPNCSYLTQEQAAALILQSGEKRQQSILLSEQISSQ